MIALLIICYHFLMILENDGYDFIRTLGKYMINFYFTEHYNIYTDMIFIMI